MFTRRESSQLLRNRIGLVTQGTAFSLLLISLLTWISEPGQWVCWDFHNMRVRPTHSAVVMRAVRLYAMKEVFQQD
jgi:hypothetical protein